MAVFDMVSPPPEHLRAQSYAINNRYFTVDTADNELVHDWVDFNKRIVTYAVQGDHVAGFFNIMPLTTECGELFMRNEILEEDLQIEHMLPHEALPFARYAYVAAIAIYDTRSYRYRQCAAALLATMADLLLDGYNRENFKMLFLNPTTFQGNKLTSRMGIKPLQPHKKILKPNDIYAVEMNDEARAKLQYMSDRYQQFVGANPWRTR